MVQSGLLLQMGLYQQKWRDILRGVGALMLDELKGSRWLLIPTERPWQYKSQESKWG